MRVVSTIVVLVPLLILPGLLFHYDVTPKAVALLAGAALAAALYRPLHLFDWLLAAQAVSLVLSTALSFDPALSLAGSNWRRFGLPAQLAVLLLAHAAARVPAGRLLRAVAGGGGLAGAYGICQYFGFDPLIPPASYHVGEGIWTIVRPPGTLGHAGYFAVYLLYVAGAGLAVATSDEDRRWRRAGAVAGLLALTAVLLNGTRAGLLGLATGVAVLAAMKGLSARRLAIGGAVAAALALFYFSPAGLALRARTRWYLEDPGGGGRVELWRDTLRMSARRWLAGYGPETYGSQFARFQSESLARRFPDRYWESPHNIYLDALAAQGAPGLAVLGAITGVGLWSLRRRPALLAGFVGALVANQFVVFTIPTALLFYVTAAPPAPTGRSVRLWPAGLVLAGAAGALAWSDYWLERTRVALAAGRIDPGAAHYRRASLPGVDTDLWYSRALYAALPGHPGALEAARRAAARSEQRANAWYNLAAFYAVRNDFTRTEESLRAAIEWAPRWYKPRWMLAQVLERAGRLPEAEVQARRAVELYPDAPPEIRNTWEQLRAPRSVP